MSPRRVALLLSVLTVAAAALVLPSALSAQGSGEPPVATAFTLVKFPVGQAGAGGQTPACTGLGLLNQLYYTRDDCGFGYADVSGTTEDSTVTAVFVGS